MSEFVYRSIVPVSAARLFRWHEGRDALVDLLPLRHWMRIEERSGGLRDGGRVVFSVGVGPLRAKWEARHFDYVAGRQFCDEQVRGPFAVWRHTHCVEAVGSEQSLYEDRIEYALPGGRLVNAVWGPVVRRALERAFARRHAIVHARLAPVPAGSDTHLTPPPADLGSDTHLTPNGTIRADWVRVHTVESVDLERYTGTWFEIARLPNRFQRRCSADVTATYTLRPDGRIDVLNRCRIATGAIEARGVARIVDARTHAKLKVRFAPAALSFLPFVWGDYWIIGLSADYAWAVVGSPDRRYLWVLSRTARLAPRDMNEALAAARHNGFDTNRLIETAQSGA